MKHKYDGIINLPHHVSKTHRPMPMHARAAQFAPFAAVSGHRDAISETADATRKEFDTPDTSDDQPEAFISFLST